MLLRYCYCLLFWPTLKGYSTCSSPCNAAVLHIGCHRQESLLTQRSARDRRRLVNHNTIPGAEYSQNYLKIRTYNSSRSSKVDDFGANRKRICEFLLVINSNFGPILHRFRDTATYWLKIAYFSYPSLIRRPRSLSSLWNCRVKLSVGKLESWGYSVVKVV